VINRSTDASSGFFQITGIAAMPAEITVWDARGSLIGNSVPPARL
jgi:hypothetical protein